MPIRKVQFENSEFYHVFNRGVEKRNIFMDNKDCLRFLKDLYFFNDSNGMLRKDRRPLSMPAPGNGELAVTGCRQEQESGRDTEPIVDIVCFCLMPNHFHLLLRQIEDNGISQFMKKVGGYSLYFNTKHERVGSLFQGPFRAVHINGDEQLKHVSRYIHLNPVGLTEPDWKERGVKDWGKINDFLENYHWSSYLDYIGKKEHMWTKKIVRQSAIMEYFDSDINKYKKYIKEWVANDLEKTNTLE